MDSIYRQLLTFVAVFAASGHAASLLVLDPTEQTRGAETVLDTSLASLGTGHALLPLLVGVEASGAAVEAPALVGEPPRLASDALRLGGAVARPT